MHTNVVKRKIKAPIEQVFDAISDHGNYDRMIGIRESVLLKDGQTEKNGLGAVRRIALEFGLIWFQEEITAFERPVRMDYQIQRCQPGLKHHGGSIRLYKIGDSTQVIWSSAIELPVPIGKDLLTRFVGVPIGQLGFHLILEQIARRLAD